MWGHQLRHTACAYYLGIAACQDVISGPFLKTSRPRLRKDGMILAVLQARAAHFFQVLNRRVTSNE